MKQVVVTGYGAVSPLGLTATDSFNALLAGEHGFGDIRAFIPENFGCKTNFAGQVCESFAPSEFSPFKEMPESDRKKQLKNFDRHQIFAMMASAEAIKMAQLDQIENTATLERIGVNYSTGVGGLDGMEKCASIANRGKKQSPFGNLRFLPNMAAGYISNLWNFSGPNNAHCTACAAGAHSMADAYNAIVTGEADIIVAGAAEAAITPVGISTFNAQSALSTRNETPDLASRPFTSDRDGFVMGEGSACLILESLDSALARGAKIYAYMTGFSRTGDGASDGAITAPHPEGKGAQRAMQEAIARSGKNLQDVDYINAHATSTFADRIEINAIESVFAEHAKKIAVTSTKASTGHLLGASGALEAVFTVLSIIHGVIPFTRNLNLDDLDEHCQGVTHIIGEPKTQAVDFALSNSFGFGGTNACLAFASYT